MRKIGVFDTTFPEQRAQLEKLIACGAEVVGTAACAAGDNEGTSCYHFVTIIWQDWMEK